MPEEEDDMPPDDELGGAVCASKADAINMLTTEVATPT